MQASARTCGISAEDSVIQNVPTSQVKSSQVVKSIYFNHPSQGNSTNYYIILGPRDKAAPPTSQQINKFPPKRVKYRRALHCKPIRGKVRRIGRIFPEHVERSFLDPSQFDE